MMIHNNAGKNDNLKKPTSKYYQKADEAGSLPPEPPMSDRLSSRRKHNMWVATFIFLIIALIFWALYHFIWQYSEETEDAYVSGYPVQITTQIPGTVHSVLVKDTDKIKAGDLLIRLDDDDAQLAYDSALDGLRLAVRQYHQQNAATNQTNALVEAKETVLQNATSAYRRRLRLKGSDAVSAEELEQAKALMEGAKADLQAAKAQQQAAQAMLGNTPLDQQPTVLTVISRVKQAWLNLQRTQVRSPVDGQVAKRNVEVGQKVGSGVPLMVVIPLHQLWVEANFKETQLAHIRMGQPVIMHSDLYGKDVTFHGTVSGMSAGTGSAFSLLPPQNATGNWIKVVQRVPVRINLDESELAKYPLRIGLSMSVEVDTRNRNGDSIAKNNNNIKAITIGNTTTNDIDFTPVNDTINHILKDTK